MIGIIDYGVGNSGSIKNMLTRLDVEAVISGDVVELGSARALILPGVGSFDRAMQRLHESELLDFLETRVLVDRVPLLGICLGMHLLTRGSEEGTLPGLGWIEADTVRIRISDDTLRVPHMGWARVDWKDGHTLTPQENAAGRYYFAHSYHVRCDNLEDVLGTATHGVPFTAAVGRENISGTQFHPEKSHKYGMELIQNFANAAV